MPRESETGFASQIREALQAFTPRPLNTRHNCKTRERQTGAAVRARWRWGNRNASLVTHHAKDMRVLGKSDATVQSRAALRAKKAEAPEGAPAYLLLGIGPSPP